MFGNFTYDGKKRLPITKNYPQPFAKLHKLSFLLLVDVINVWPQSICLCEKMNNCDHCKLINDWSLTLIYFTCFLHNFVNHKYNVLLKRHDVCLMPLNTFVCVSHPVTVKTSSVWSSWNVREQIKDVALKKFLSSAKSLHRYFNNEPSHFILFTH